MKKTVLLIAIVFIVSVLGKVNGQIITTIAGTGISGYNGDNIPATAAQIFGCVYVVADRFGNIYLSEIGDNRVRKINNAGIITTFAGTGTSGFSGDGGPASAAMLNTPKGLATDIYGNLFIADAGNNRIRKVTYTGIITTVAGSDSSGFSGDLGPATLAALHFPNGVAVDSLGDIFIADTYNNCIRQVDTSHRIFSLCGYGGVPGGYGGDGSLAGGASLNFPTDIVVDKYLNLYVADMSNNRVRKIDSLGWGNINTVVGNGSMGYSGDGGYSTDAELNAPSGLAIDYNGNLYISDQSNQRIREVNSSGVIFTIGGNGIPGYGGDNDPAILDKLNSPQNVAIGPNGDIYISDFGNNRVRKIGYNDAVSIINNQNLCVLFPNPINNRKFTVSVPTTNDEINIDIFSTDGIQYKSINTISNKINELGTDIFPGMYFFRIVAGKSTWWRKVIVSE